MKKAGAKPAEEVTQIRLKAAALKRNMKDLEFAVAEVAKEKQRLEKFERETPDKISQQRKVIEEAEMMVPLARNRIQRSYAELNTVLSGPDVANVPEDNEELVKAREAAAAAAQLIASFDDLNDPG